MNASGARPSVGGLLCLVAIVVFALGVFGVHPGGLGPEKVTDLGLVFFAAGVLVP